MDVPLSPSLPLPPNFRFPEETEFPELSKGSVEGTAQGELMRQEGRVASETERQQWEDGGEKGEKGDEETYRTS